MTLYCKTVPRGKHCAQESKLDPVTLPPYADTEHVQTPRHNLQVHLDGARLIEATEPISALMESVSSDAENPPSLARLSNGD